MYSIDLSRMIEHLQTSDCMEIINELTPISGIEVYEIDKDHLIRFVMTEVITHKDEIVMDGKHYYESIFVKNVTQTLLDITEGIKYDKVLVKVCNGKIERCVSVITLLRNIIGEYHVGQNKEIIDKAFKDRIDFY